MKRKIIVNDLLPLFYFNLIKYETIDISGFSNQYICLDDPNTEIIFIISEGYFDLSIDKSNQIFNTLPLGAFHEKYEAAFSSLESALAGALGEALQKLSGDDVEIRTNVLSNLTNPYFINVYPSFKNIFTKERYLLDELNTNLNLFVEELIEDGLLPEDFEEPILTELNFPKYWAEE